MRVRPLLLAALLAAGLSGCAPPSTASTAPRCRDWERLGLLAQAVPSAGYVPCIVQLPAGWAGDGFTVQRGSAQFRLISDRAQGRAVTVHFDARCRVTAAAPFPTRTAGGRSYLTLGSLRPRYRGALIDAFPGGCVRYQFDFARGPHIALMAELQQAVGYVSRVELRQQLHHRLGVELGP